PIRYFDFALFPGSLFLDVVVDLLNVFGERRYGLPRHEKQFLLIPKCFFETAKRIGWKFPRVEKPMVFRIQCKFRCGPGVDQDDILRVTPNGARDLTSESRHRTRPFPPTPRRLRRSFDPAWKSRQSGQPY